MILAYIPIHIYLTGESSIIFTPPLETARQESTDNNKSKHYATSKSNSKPSHLYNLVAAAYLSMQTMNQDQSIIANGLQNSGKTYTNKLVARHLMDLSKGLSLYLILLLIVIRNLPYTLTHHCLLIMMMVLRSSKKDQSAVCKIDYNLELYV